MTVMNTRIERGEQHCLNNGIRLTARRKQVLDGLLIADKALSAYELIEICREHFNVVIPAMTVYRILDYLKQQHLVHKIEVSNKFIACSHLCCNNNLSHEHDLTQFLICDQCHRVEEISIEPTTAAQLRQNFSAVGFVPTNNQLEIRCLCACCNASKKQ